MLKSRVNVRCQGFDLGWWVDISVFEPGWEPLPLISNFFRIVSNSTVREVAKRIKVGSIYLTSIIKNPILDKKRHK